MCSTEDSDNFKGGMIYAMSDIHGCLAEFETALSLVDLSGDNKLILLGDYIHGGDEPYAVLDRIMALERAYGEDKVIVLAGNHEDMAVNGALSISAHRFSMNSYDDDLKDEKYLNWMQNLRRYYKTERQIFCHAGIDEEAADMWEWGTEDYTFTEKYPPELGKFLADICIIAGHAGTAEISGNPNFHEIFYDGESHYYIDGSVLESGVIPVMKIDTEQNKYYRVTESGEWLILPYDEEK